MDTRKLLLILLVGSLILNLYTISQVSNLQDQVAANQRNLTNIHHALSGEISGIGRAVNDIHQQGEWISKQNLFIENTPASQDEIPLNLEFSLREVPGTVRFFSGLKMDSSGRRWFPRTWEEIHSWPS